MKIPFVRKDKKKILQSPKRTREEIQTHYKDLSAIAGDKGYKKDVLEAEIRQIHEAMFNLNQENAALPKPEVVKDVATEQAI